MRMTALSASRIKTFKQCPMKYFLEYHLSVPETREGNIYTHKGSAVHEALEFWVNAVLGKEERAEIDYKKTLMDYYKESKLWTMDIRKPDKGGDPVESAINALENHGLNRCPDRGIEGFERYVSLAVLGRNLQILGNLIQQKRFKIEQKQQNPKLAA